MFAATPTPTPTPDPCAQYDKTADAENDGVNDYDECVYGLRPDKADTDADGLTDSQELYKLGTNGSDPDTDGDVITDTLEVEGFTYGGKQWYLDPTNPDTNSDGLVDSVDCPALVDIAHPTEDRLPHRSATATRTASPTSLRMTTTTTACRTASTWPRTNGQISRGSAAAR